jgi:GDPmannose 4,6-dehydratase
MAANVIDIDLSWEGQGIDEVGIDRRSGRTVVRINPRFFRPAEVDLLLGDASKAARELGWRATTPLPHICEEMVLADIRRITSGNDH